MSIHIKYFINKLTLLVFLATISVVSFSQDVLYSSPDQQDGVATNYEIIGKMNGNILVYKNFGSTHIISVLDGSMNQLKRIKIDYLSERVFNVDFLAYPDYAFMFYQYQKKNIVYCMAVKIDAMGNKLGDAMQLDTTDISYTINNKIYSLLYSEDKKKIMFYKVNSKSDKLHFVTTLLFDNQLRLLQKTRMEIPMPDRNDFLTEFQLDNLGDLVFVRAVGSNQNDNISKLWLLTKKSDSTHYNSYPIKIDGSVYLDEIRVKCDNFNRNYLLFSFYGKQRRGDVKGLLASVWSKDSTKEITSALIEFSDEFRTEARAEGGLKAAFNDYFLKSIIIKRDGGFIVTAESEYTSSRGNSDQLSRWDYLSNSPRWSTTDYYSYNSPYLSSYPWSSNRMYNNFTRYYADNIAMMSFTVNGKMEWSNVIRKSQFDESTDEFISFGTVNTGSQVNFLFNVLERRQNILTCQNIDAEGQLHRNATFKNLDRGYDFVPRHCKQVGAKQVIIPCMYKNYLCFAKIEF